MKRAWIYSLLCLAGCASADIVIRNPLVANAVDRNAIVKQHDFVERQRSLPHGVLADEAALTRLGNEDICFDVTLHELDPIDLANVRVKLDVPGQVPREVAKLWPERPVAHDYPGLVPNRVQVGYESFCAARDYNGICVAWATRPTYATVLQPGTVQVYETRGRMCFPNGGFVSPATDNIRLELTVPRPAKSYASSYNGFGWAWGGGDKRTRFDWGFAVQAQPKKKK